MANETMTISDEEMGKRIDEANGASHMRYGRDYKDDKAT